MTGVGGNALLPHLPRDAHDQQAALQDAGDEVDEPSGPIDALPASVRYVRVHKYVRTRCNLQSV